MPPVCRKLPAKLSLASGQIYRYFANKDAIIEEMVRRIIDFRIAQMDIDARTDHFPEVLALRKSLNEDDGRADAGSGCRSHTQPAGYGNA